MSKDEKASTIKQFAYDETKNNDRLWPVSYI
jgi:hypothetical protein